MKISEVLWPDTPTHNTGRNGTFECHGLCVWTSRDNRIFFDPIARSGKVLNGGFSVPVSKIPELVAALVTVVMAYDSSDESDTTDQGVLGSGERAAESG